MALVHCVHSSRCILVAIDLGNSSEIESIAKGEKISKDHFSYIDDCSYNSGYIRIVVFSIFYAVITIFAHMITKLDNSGH